MSLLPSKTYSNPNPHSETNSASDLLTLEGGSSNLPPAQDKTLEVNLNF